MPPFCNPGTKRITLSAASATFSVIFRRAIITADLNAVPLPASFGNTYSVRGVDRRISIVTEAVL